MMWAGKLRTWWNRFGTRQSLISWDQHAFESSVQERFSKVAESCPEQIALVGSEGSYSYRELEDASAATAGALWVEFSGKRGRTVLLMRHDAPLVIAALALLKAGQTVVVANATDPPTRIGAILRDSEAEFLLCDRNNLLLAGQIAEDFGPRLLVWEEWRDRVGDTSVLPVCSGSDVAWLVYTSGSTGQPKGVMHSHGLVLHNVWRKRVVEPLHVGDRVALLSALSSGQGVGVVWWALLNGCSLHPFPVAERGFAGMAEWIRRSELSILSFSVSVFRGFCSSLREHDGFPSVRQVRLASEASRGGDWRQFRRVFSDSCKMVAAYSQSESGAIAMGVVDEAGDEEMDPLPVGVALPGVEIEILGDDGQVLDPGQEGEIVVRGRYLTSGYWNRPDQSTIRPDPERPGIFILHTRDRGWWLHRGVLLVRGRVDEVVKVHGFRVALGEVESALLSNEGVLTAVVTSQEVKGSTELVAWVVKRQDAACDEDSLRSEMRSRVARHAVPRQFVFLNELPLNAHGKPDRKALARRGAPAASPESRRSPQTEAPILDPTTALVAQAWKEAFDIEAIGAEDDFFALGGDSLAAAVIAAKLEQVSGGILLLEDFVKYPTVRTLAAYLSAHVDGVVPAGRQRAQRQPTSSEATSFPLSFSQEELWHFVKDPAMHAAATQKSRHRICGPLDPEAFRLALGFIFRRHSSLRTVFREKDGQPVQVLLPSLTPTLEILDVSDDPDPNAAIGTVQHAFVQREIDLENGPLVYLALVKIADQEFNLLRVSHHLISDAQSWHLFFRELGVLHHAIREGRTIPLSSEPGYQLSDFAVWQREMEGESQDLIQRELDRWRSFLQAGPAKPRLPMQRKKRVDGLPSGMGFIKGTSDASVGASMRSFREDNGLTVFVVRLAVFAAQIALETGERRMILSTHLSARLRPEWQDLFGFLVGDAMLPLEFSGEPGLRTWSRMVRRELERLHVTTHLPHHRIYETLRQEGLPMPGHRIFCSISDPPDRGMFGDLEIDPLPIGGHAMPPGFALRFGRKDEDAVRFYFDAGRFDPDAVRAFLHRYQRLLALALAHPDRPLRALWDAGPEASGI